MTRGEANLQILADLSEYLTNNPDMRFGQALRNTGIIQSWQDEEGDIIWANHFMEEPQNMLKRMERTKKQMEEQNESN